MIKIATLMDPISQISPYKDTSFELLLNIQEREHDSYYIEPNQLWLEDGIVWATMHRIQVKDQSQDWYNLGEAITQPLTELDAILLRKDPPFDMEYVYLTYMLELCEQHDVLVINKPRSVRDANEKLFTSWFPQCCPPSLVTSCKQRILDFLEQHQHAIIKPLDGMGGNGIYQLKLNDPNRHAIIDAVSQLGTRTVMTQLYLPEIKHGDKRILMVNGEAHPYGLARVPSQNDFRGNLSAGAQGQVFELSDSDLWIASQVGPTLQQKGLSLVGLDVIGEHLTEINVTSPTCVREIQRETQTQMLNPLLDFIESQCQT